MLVRFWGTRGSIAKPGPTTLRYGGNTSCMEVRAADGTLLVLDAGTGAYALGHALIEEGANIEPAHLLIGHTHWDHIQGFPFFAPLFAPGRRWEIYAPGSRGRQLETALAGQMDYEYFPINLEELAADVHLHDLCEGSFDAGSMRVTTRYMNHPALTLGYRIEADGATLVYATDHEPHSLHPLDAPVGSRPLHHEDERHVEFLEGADLLVHDAQFTLAEFPARQGWGHSPVERVIDYAIAARAKRVALYHHDPERTDDQLDSIVIEARKLAADAEFVPEIFAAAEGQQIALHGPPRKEQAPPRVRSSRT